jgi:hypothetical protein
MVVGRKEVSGIQEFSKQEQEAFGILVEVVTTMGTWSEVRRGREVNEEARKTLF